MVDADNDPTMKEAREAAKLALLKRIKVAAEDRSAHGTAAREMAEAYAWLVTPNQSH
jgi:hypothetical protein